MGLHRGACAALEETSLVALSGGWEDRSCPMAPLALLLVNEELLFFQKLFITVQDADPLCWF